MRLSKVGMLYGGFIVLLCSVGSQAMTQTTVPGSGNTSNNNPQNGNKDQPVAPTGGIKTVPSGAGIIDRSVMLTTANAYESAGVGALKMSNPFGLPTARVSPTVAGDGIVNALGTDGMLFLLALRQSPRLHLVRQLGQKLPPGNTPLEREFFEYIAQRRTKPMADDIKAVLITSARILSGVKDEKSVSREVLRLQATYNVLLYDFIENRTKPDQSLRYKTQVVDLEEQSRAIGDQNYFVTNVHYGNVNLRTDLSAQYFTGNSNGYGFAVHYDLVGFSPKGIRDRNVLKKLASDQFLKTAKLLVGKYQEDTRLVRYVLAPQAGLTFDYRHLEGFGELYGLGISESLLIPLTPTKEKRTPAIYSSVGLRYGWLQQSGTSGNPTKGLGASAVLAWQDNSPSYTNTILEYGREVATVKLDRWRQRIGVEFAQGNAIVKGDYGAFFFRYRGKGKEEYSVLIGSESNGVGFFGFNASTYFAW